jgi:hypothetical protein
MQAWRDRCSPAIFELVIIGSLLCERRGSGGKIGHHHVGDDGTHFGKVEGDESGIHCYLPKLLAPAQEFRVDRTNLVERRAHCGASFKMRIPRQSG